MVRVTSTKGLKEGRGITLEKLRFREENKTWFVKNCKVFEGVNITMEALNIPSQ